MNEYLFAFIARQSFMKVVRAIFLSKKACWLREIVDLTGLSPAGTRDIVRRLLEDEVLKARPRANKIFYSLNLNKNEEEFLEQLFEEQTMKDLKARAEIFSMRRTQAIGWIDETIRKLRYEKKRINHTLNLLKLVTNKLKSINCQYAVCGGLAATYYRNKPRLTNDVDIAFISGNEVQSKKKAIKIVESLGYESAFGWISEAFPKLKDTTPIVIGSINGSEYGSTIDFLLPSLPWVLNGVKRAQTNLVDFNFAKLPTLTPEDLIIAKTFALAIEPNRFQDLDDLKAIFKAKNELDLAYIASEFRRLNLSAPKALNSVVPKALKRISRKET